jgi:hypothetical protein
MIRVLGFRIDFFLDVYQKKNDIVEIEMIQKACSWLGSDTVKQ